MFFYKVIKFKKKDSLIYFNIVYLYTQIEKENLQIITGKTFLLLYVI